MVQSRIWHCLTVAALFAAVTISLPVKASGPIDAEAVLAEAAEECASIDDGRFERDEGAVLSVDLGSDSGNDVIIDFSKLHCTSAASFWCGSGGCSLVVLTSGKRYDFLARAFKTVEWFDREILLLSLHGSACGGAGAEPCFAAYFWHNGELRQASVNDR
ncbi:MAG: hypothetical protein AAGE61_04260 [Pseudomonadota bacterium]